MSMFLPENTQQAQPADGVAVVTPSNPETTQDDIALMQRVLAAASRNPNLIPTDFMAYVFDFIQTQRLEVPIGQVFGYSRTTAQPAFVAAQESRAVSAFGDLATVGPSITGLGAGLVLVFWGAGALGSAGVSNAEMIVKDNHGNTTDHGGLAFTSSSNFTSVAAADTITLTAGGSLTAKYASSDNASTCQWIDRWMIALRLS